MICSRSHPARDWQPGDLNPCLCRSKLLCVPRLIKQINEEHDFGVRLPGLCLDSTLKGRQAGRREEGRDRRKGRKEDLYIT